MQKDPRASWFQRIERRYAWGFLGFVIGILGIALAVLALREKRPDVVYSTLSASNVLDVHTAVPSLDVTYQGQSLQRTNLNLKIINVQIENDGDVDILQGQFDDKVPWGFRITAGRIVEIRTIGASSTYLADRFLPKRLSDSQVGFERVILDRGSSVVVQAVVLHPKNEEPTIVPTGKIAGVDHLRMRQRPVDDGGRTLPSAFKGSPLVQLLRFTAYGLSFLMILIGGALGIGALSDAHQSARLSHQRKEINDVLDTVGVGDSTRQILEKVYAFPGGREAIAELHSLLTNRERAAEVVESYHRESRLLETQREAMLQRIEERRGVIFRDPTTLPFRFLVRNGVVRISEDDQLTVSDEFLRDLTAVHEQLRGLRSG